MLSLYVPTYLQILTLYSSVQAQVSICIIFFLLEKFVMLIF